jgi:hypothetical protein
MKYSVLLLLAIFAGAYSATISGTVIEYHSLTPIESCLVKFDSLSLTAKTDSTLTNASGTFVCILQSGVYKVHFVHNSYVTDSIPNYAVVKDSSLGTRTLYSKTHTYLPGEALSGIWDKANNPYVLLGSHDVPVNKTLNINEGCLILFPDSGSISAIGVLKAIGTIDDSIFFDGQSAIDLDNNSLSDSNMFSYCDFKNARLGGLHYVSTAGKSVVTNCLFQENYSGLYLWHGGMQDTLIIENCLFVHNKYDLFNAGGGPRISIIKNTVFAGSSYGNIDGMVSAQIENCLFETPIQINNITTVTKDNIFLNLDLSLIKGTFEYNCAYPSSGSPPPGIASLALVNANGDSCDLYYNIFKNPKVDTARLEIDAASPCIAAGGQGENIGPSLPVGHIGAVLFGKKPPSSGQNDFSVRLCGSPFGATLNISFKTQYNEMTILRICDSKGKCVRTLVQSVQQPGFHSVSWDNTNFSGKKVPPGLYLVLLKQGDHNGAKKVFIAR